MQSSQWRGALSGVRRPGFPSGSTVFWQQPVTSGGCAQRPGTALVPDHSRSCSGCVALSTARFVCELAQNTHRAGVSETQDDECPVSAGLV